MQKIIPTKDNSGVTVVFKTNRKKNIVAKGVSRCNFDDGDQFDSGLGTELAVTRCEISYEKQKKQYYKKRMESLMNQAKQFEKLMQQCDETIAQYEQAIGIRLSITK